MPPDSSSSPFRVLIAGGGVTGLAAAHRLQSLAGATHPPLELHLLESSERLGGCLQTARRDGFLLERGPDCFLSEKPRGIERIREIGLSDQILNTQTDFRRGFILRQGALHPIPEGFYLLAPSRLAPFLRSPLMSWGGKARMLLEPFIPRRKPADESLASFVRRRMGSEALERLAQPLVAGIYAADPRILSLRATFPRFIEMERQGGILRSLRRSETATRRASGARYSLFVSLRDGLQTLTDALERSLPPGVVHRGTSVRALRRQAGEGGGEGASSAGRKRPWRIETDHGFLEADAVILALPSHAAARILSELDPSLSAQLASISYAGVATLHLAYAATHVGNPLEGFGYVAPAREGRAVMACTFAHRKFPGRAPRGTVLLRAFIGGALQESLLSRSDEELTALALSDLTPLLNLKGKPLWTSLQRWPRAMPQYAVGHLERIEAIEQGQERWPGLALAGNWLRGVGVPDCIESGERAADAVARVSLVNPQDFPSPGTPPGGQRERVEPDATADGGG